MVWDFEIPLSDAEQHIDLTEIYKYYIQELQNIPSKEANP